MNPPNEPLSRNWKLFLAFALVAGAVLRLIFVSDMEYKQDEEYMVYRLLNVGKTEPWPWLGIPSGVHVKNPGMSVWVFILLGRLFGATEPMGLCRAVQVLNIAALLLLLAFAIRWLKSEERTPWLWAVALASVNPFAILYHRKIWAQSVLPFFSMLFIMSWWRRGTAWGAFFWGVIGACIGQIHMSGFFFAAGFALWGLLFDRQRIRWMPWIAGSALGSITLIPWLHHLFTERTGQPMVFGWGEAVQLKFWVFWITDAIGLHLGNPLGVMNGNGALQQLGDFLRYPLIGGSPTYLVGAAHAAMLLWGVVTLSGGLTRFLRGPGIRWRDYLIGTGSETALARNAQFFAYGLLITITGVAIHRYYLIITFPFEWIWLAQLVFLNQSSTRRAHAWLGVLFALQLFVSASFLGYIHVNDGSVRGDYGPAYRVQDRAFLKQQGP